MKRMGFFTGKIYDENVGIDYIQECCTTLNSIEPILSDELLMIRRREQLKEACKGCFKCELAKVNHTITNVVV